MLYYFMLTIQLRRSFFDYFLKFYLRYLCLLILSLFKCDYAEVDFEREKAGKCIHDQHELRHKVTLDIFLGKTFCDLTHLDDLP